MRTRTKLLWVVLLYFAQGFPFGIVNDCFPVFFRVHGVGLREIGLFSLIGLPWSLKFLWSPLVDRFAERRTWIAGALVAMAAILFVLPGIDASRPTTLVWALLLGFTIASATQDIAIDAYTIGLLEPREVGPANGLRVSAYRVALILGGGGIVVLAETMSWNRLFVVAGGLLLILAAIALRTPRVSRDPQMRGRLIPMLVGWIRRPAAPAVFLFVLTYKLGDAAMAPMVKPFWVDRGMTLVEIGLISTTLGVAATIAGALAGGWMLPRLGLFRGLWLLGLLQAGSNLVYAGVAASDAARGAIYVASLFESFTGGLGTAAFLAFLMTICEREQAATEYALLSALFGLTRSVAGGFSGWGTERLGYAPYFAVTFLLALPAYLLLPWVGRYLRALPSPSAGERGQA
jgi:MFS transporter, PAT family, beta-lactamase induction signal transducer AmpG